jgi:hypothetical protein
MRWKKDLRSGTTAGASGGEPAGVTDGRASERAAQRLAALGPLRRAECGRSSDGDAAGWRGYRTNLEEDAGLPAVATFCPDCAAREFD